MKKILVTLSLALLICFQTCMTGIAGEEQNEAGSTPPIDISAEDSGYQITLSKSSFDYTGQPITLADSEFEIVHRAVGETETTTSKLDKSFFTITYENNVQLTTAEKKATLIAEGDGVHYSGTLEAEFEIKAFTGSTTLTTTPANKVIKLTWKKQSAADGYQVYRSTSNKTGTFKKTATISGGTNCSYRDTTVTMGTTYYYKVRSYRKIEEKTYTGTFSAVKTQRAQVAKTTNVKATGSGATAVKVTWSKVAGAEGYAVYRSTTKNGTYKKIATISSAKTLQYKDQTVTCGRSYYYKVKAYRTINGKKQYGYYSDADFGRARPKSTTITGATSTKTTIKLKWKQAAGASGYLIYRDAGDGYKKVKTITKGTTLTWTDKDCANTQAYSYKIRSYTIVDQTYVYSSSYSKVYKRKASGWRYVNGYKLYYDSKGNVVQDVRSILGKRSSYVIKVNKKQCITTVYAKDGSNGYIIPVVAFICSPGSVTPLGTFYTPEKYRWHELYGNVYGQWDTRITGNILFHSVYYNSKNDKYTLDVSSYNKLGTAVSKGCIRLQAKDAKWIYDNCSLKTKVVIYNSSKAEPLDKPTIEKLPSWHTWDPTDPNVKSKCKAKGCH